MSAPRATRNLAILVFDDVEVLDFCGPFEVFSVTVALEPSGDDPHRPFHVYLVAERLQPVIARNGLSVNPHYSIANCPRPDVLLVPGGQGTRREMHNPRLMEWITGQADRSELLLSVCTGALLLGKAGLLDGLTVTTHHGAIDLLQQTAPTARVIADRRFVDNGRLVTSAGISAGIDMSLYVVSRLLGQDAAQATARHMEYDWRAS